MVPVLAAGSGDRPDVGGWCLTQISCPVEGYLHLAEVQVFETPLEHGGQNILLLAGHVVQTMNMMVTGRSWHESQVDMRVAGI